MPLSKYLRNDQKILLRLTDSENQGQKIETLSTFLRDCGSGFCDLALPYRTPPGEEFPFENGMPLELLGDAMGLGIRVVGQFDRQIDTETIRVRVEPDLQVFQRRLHRRHDGLAGVRFTRGEGTLRSFREQWQKNVRLLQLPVNQAKLNGLPTLPVNISAGGIRLLLRPPVAAADLYMLFIKIDTVQPPVCILAEVVWTGDETPGGLIPAGMQFINILKQDQQRIESYIKQVATAEDAGKFS